MNKKKKYRELNDFKETQINEKYKKLTFTIVLVKPEHLGNIGSIARVMENFNFEHLIIFNPIESVEKIFSYKTQGFAMHGKTILFNAEIINVENQENHISEFKDFLKKFDLIIGTTAKGKKYTNLQRLPIFLEDLSIPISKKPLNIAILFGKESRGLTNEEISLSDIAIRIPTSNNYSALNLSHACGIVIYEIFKKISDLNIGRGEHPVLLADKEDRGLLYVFISDLIKVMRVRQYREKNVLQAFKNVFERSLMSKKELSLIYGLFTKINSFLKDENWSETNTQQNLK